MSASPLKVGVPTGWRGWLLDPAHMAMAHGTLNAVGFATLAFFGWSIIRPKERERTAWQELASAMATAERVHVTVTTSWASGMIAHATR